MENFKLLILVLAGNTKISNRNKKAQTNTWIKDLPQNSHVVFYQGGEETKIKNNILTVKSSDKYQDIGYKTLQAFDWVNSNLNFDYIIRINTSTFLNTNKLIQFLTENKNEYLYRGRILNNKFNENHVKWVSGAEILMSKNTFKLLLKNKNKFDFSLPDDVAIGKLLLSLGVKPQNSDSKIFNIKVFDNTKLEYGYHFRCRVDDPYYYPRILDSIFMKFLHKESQNLKIKKSKRYFYKTLFLFSKPFAIKKHIDFLQFYFWKFLKKISPSAFIMYVKGNKNG